MMRRETYEIYLLEARQCLEDELDSLKSASIVNLDRFKEVLTLIKLAGSKLNMYNNRKVS